MNIKLAIYEEQIDKRRELLKSEENNNQIAEKKIKDLDKVNEFYRGIMNSKMEEVGEKFTFVNSYVLEYRNAKEDNVVTDILKDIIIAENDTSKEDFVIAEQYNEL